METPSSSKKSSSPRKISAGTLVQNIFDPIYKEGVVIQEPDSVEESVFFEERKAPPVPEPEAVAPLPPTQPETVRKKFIGQRVAVWISVSILIFLSAHMTLCFLEVDSSLQQSVAIFKSHQRQLASLEAKWVAMKTEEEKLKGQLEIEEERKRSLGRSIDFLQKRMRRGPSRAALLGEWARLRPAGIWFREWSLKEKEIRLRGYSSKRRVIARFLLGLHRSPHLVSLKVSSLSLIPRQSGAIYAFEITAHEVP